MQIFEVWVDVKVPGGEITRFLAEVFAETQEQAAAAVTVRACPAALSKKTQAARLGQD